MHWGDYGWGWGMGFGLGWLFMAIFWIVVILGIVYLVKLISGGAGKEKKEEAALDILKKRYARGEISKEEFDRIKDDIIKP